MSYQIVIDTNVLISAIQSPGNASYQLLRQVGTGQFEINISVPLLLEYEAVSKRFVDSVSLNIDSLLDYLCNQANKHGIYYLWRPFLPDPQDDMVLELAVKARCEFIVSYNQRHFRGVEQFGIQVITPNEFLQRLGGAE